MGYGAFYVICPRASSQSVTPLLTNWRFIIVINDLVTSSASCLYEYSEIYDVIVKDITIEHHHAASWV